MFHSCIALPPPRLCTQQRLTATSWFSRLGVRSTSGTPTPSLVWRPSLAGWSPLLFYVWPRRRDRVSCTTVFSTRTRTTSAAGDLMLSMVIVILSWSRLNRQDDARRPLLMVEAATTLDTERSRPTSSNGRSSDYYCRH